MNTLYSVREASIDDIRSMVELSYVKRRDYEKAQPQFWRYANDAEKIQQEWFEELLAREDHTILVANLRGQIVGFIIGRIMKAPEVYDPGGLTLMIDDFCVLDSEQWKTVGRDLIKNLQNLAKKKGASQTLVVCGSHDQNKREFLQSLDLQVASEWYVGGIEC